jgi:hypothetical protein
MLSSGTSFQTATVWATYQGLNNGVWAGDFNGDGWCDKVTHVNSTDPAWRGWWVAKSQNTSSRQVGMFSVLFWYKQPGINPLDDPDVEWRRENRDSLKTPVVGWGADTTVGEYSSQDRATLRRQIKAMKTCGVDFLLMDLSNGRHPVVPTYAPWNGDGTTYNAIDTLFKTMNEPTSDKLSVAFFLGLEFWGASSLCAVPTWQYWDGWNNQYQRQTNTVNDIRTRYINGYPSLYYKYLGKPLAVLYLDFGLDYPPVNDDGTTRPRWNFPDLTIRHSVNWGMTYPYTKTNFLGACAPYITGLFDGISTKRFWGWGSGAEDGTTFSDSLLPRSSEVMSIMAGTRLWQAPGDPEKINRQGGNFCNAQNRFNCRLVQLG